MKAKTSSTAMKTANAALRQYSRRKEPPENRGNM